MRILSPTISGSLIISGSVSITGSISATNGITASYATISEQIGATFDGQTAIITGSTGYYRSTYPFTITNWYIDATPSGTATFDIKIGGNSIIEAGNAPTITSNTAASASVSGWATSSIPANTLLQYSISGSVTSITWAKLTLQVNRT